jgi:hypothetical protein
MAGSICVQSKVGKGTEFAITFKSVCKVKGVPQYEYKNLALNLMMLQEGIVSKSPDEIEQIDTTGSNKIDLP